MLFDFYKFCTWSVTKKELIKSIYIALNKKIRLVKSTWVYFKNEFSDVIYSNFTFFYPRVPILSFLTSWQVCRSAKNLTFKNSDRIMKLVNFAILLCRENIHLVKSFFEEQMHHGMNAIHGSILQKLRDYAVWTGFDKLFKIAKLFGFFEFLFSMMSFEIIAIK